jgi:Flp pilus assembly protein TadB
LLLSHASGGAISQALEDLATSARAEVQLRRAIRSQQASGETAARITLVIPIIVFVFLRAFSPGAADFYSSPFGEVLSWLRSPGAASAGIMRARQFRC